MGMALDNGGHLTHGSPANFSGKLYHVVSYGCGREDRAHIDMDAVAALAREARPKVIIAGASAYPRVIDFEGFAQIAHEVGAASHGGHGPHRRPRGHRPPSQSRALRRRGDHHYPQDPARTARAALILCNDPDLAKRVDSAVFPGSQGGPLEHVIAGKAVAFGEALAPDFAAYTDAVLANAKALGRGMESRGLPPGLRRHGQPPAAR